MVLIWWKGAMFNPLSLHFFKFYLFFSLNSEYGCLLRKLLKDFSSCSITNSSFILPHPRLYPLGSAIFLTSSSDSSLKNVLKQTSFSLSFNSRPASFHLVIINSGNAFRFSADSSPPP